MCDGYCSQPRLSLCTDFHRCQGGQHEACVAQCEHHHICAQAVWVHPKERQEHISRDVRQSREIAHLTGLVDTAAGVLVRLQSLG